jgi:hypothetical protein
MSRRAVPAAVLATRNLVTTRRNSFRTYQPCPDDPYIDDPCLSQGGSDQNIYAARL